MIYLEKWKQKHQTISSHEKFININIPKTHKLLIRATRMAKKCDIGGDREESYMKDQEDHWIGVERTNS